MWLLIFYVQINRSKIKFFIHKGKLYLIQRKFSSRRCLFMKKEKSSKENKEKEIVEEKQLLQPKIDVVFQSLFNKC